MADSLPPMPAAMPTDPAAGVAARYRAIAADYLARVEGVAAWDVATPCDGWTARDLVAHSVNVHRRMLVRLDGGELPDMEPAPAAPGEDLPGELRALAGAVQGALDGGRGGEVVESPAGPVAFAELVGTLLCADTLVHTWDLARATGQDERLDPSAVGVALEFMLPRDAGMRRPGGFGPRLDAPEGADAQTRLLLFCGRRV